MQDWSECQSAEGVATLSCAPTIFVNIISAAVFLAGLVALFIIILAGSKYIRSRGDQAAIEEAKRTLTYGILGLFFVFASFFIVRIIGQATGVTQLNDVVEFIIGNFKDQPAPPEPMDEFPQPNP